MLKPKLKHLRHPLQTVEVAMKMAAAYMDMRLLAYRGGRHFAGDPRYKLEHVSAGFVSRRPADKDDTALLKRICRAYNATLENTDSSDRQYKATGWWEQVRDRSLGPVRQALRMGDIAALRRMYRNFFRDPCCTGLAAVPYGMTEIYFGGGMRDLHRRLYLSDALYRLDYWRSQTCGRFHVRDLAIPEIGNPYGVCLEETLVSARAEFHHYCADRVASLLESKLSTVVEIGGGFGAMAYYLLRDQPTIKYCDFDVPESTALATYFLIHAMPHKKFLLYGEDSLTEEAIADADIVLMPLFALKRLPTASADVTFSSHAMADIEAAELASYLSTIHRLTRNYFLFLGTITLPHVPGLMGESCDPFQLIEQRRLQWNRHRRAPSEEVECLYSFHHAYQATQSPGRDLEYVRR